MRLFYLPLIFVVALLGCERSAVAVDTAEQAVSQTADNPEFYWYGDRAIQFGGDTPSYSNVIQYYTIYQNLYIYEHIIFIPETN